MVIWFPTCVESWGSSDCSQSHLAIGECNLSIPEEFIYAQQEVLAMVHTPPFSAKENLGPSCGP
jgi:hypothetical protein